MASSEHSHLPGRSLLVLDSALGHNQQKPLRRALTGLPGDIHHQCPQVRFLVNLSLLEGTKLVRVSKDHVTWRSWPLPLERAALKCVSEVSPRVFRSSGSAHSW